MKDLDLYLVTTLLLSTFPLAAVLFSSLKGAAFARTPRGRALTLFAAVLSGVFLTLLVFGPQAHPDPLDGGERLIGRWEAFNDSEPEKYAIWEFEKGKDGVLTVSGMIYEARDLRKMTGLDSMQEKTVPFGPETVRLIEPDGTLTFSYASDHGTGTTTLAATQGFVGTYRDDPKRTPADQIDDGRSAFYRPQGGLALSQTVTRGRASLATLLLAWASGGLALLLAWRLGILSRQDGSILLRLIPIAVLLVVFLGLGRLLAIRQIDYSLTRETLQGEWVLEDLTNRTRLGEVLVDPPMEGDISLTGELYYRKGFGPRDGEPQKDDQQPLTRRSREHRDRMVVPSVDFDESRRSLAFDYDMWVGVGRSELRQVPTLTGGFVDIASEESQEKDNFGHLLLIRLES